MKVDYQGLSLQVDGSDLEDILRGILPETPKEALARWRNTKGWTPPIPGPRFLGKVLQAFDW